MKRVALVVVLLILASGLFFWLANLGPGDDASDLAEFEESHGNANGAESDFLKERTSQPGALVGGIAEKVEAVNNTEEKSVPERVVVSFKNTEELELSPEKHTHVVREWKGRLEPPMNAKLLGGAEAGGIFLEVPDGRRLSLDLRSDAQSSSGRGVFMGKVSNSNASQVVLSFVNQAVAGSIREMGTNLAWEIRNAGRGQQYMALVDVTELGNCPKCKLTGGTQ